MRIILLLVCLASCGNEDADESRVGRCERLRDHLVDVRLADATGVDKEAHRAAMKQALGDRFIARCADLDDAHLDCAFAASDNAALAACGAKTATR